MNFKKYLLWFANEHLDFRLHEINSIASCLKIDFKWNETPADDPFWIIELDSDESIRKIAARAVTLRYVIDLWSKTNSVDELHKSLKSLSPTFFEPYRHLSFKMKVEIFGSSQTQKEKVDKIESFSYLPLCGQVKLRNPELAFQYIENYGLEGNKSPESPKEVYFGRIIADGQRDLIAKHSLKLRKFIGNTSMDPQLSLIMANQAQISRGDIVLDPFVGSGSLLIAAAEFGGYVLGADIDYLMLHGKSRPTRKQDRDKPRKNESVLTNMKQYGLESQYLDVVVADSSLPLWRPGLLLDAVLTDPPYGMREAMERVGCLRSDKKIDQAHLPSHIPSKVQYSLGQLLADLLQFSSHHLKLGGRLVTWIPIIRCEYNESKLPSHPCLLLIGNSEQVLSTTSSRRLLTYVKVEEPEVGSGIKNEDYANNYYSFRDTYLQYVQEIRRTKSEKGQNYRRNKCDE